MVAAQPDLTRFSLTMASGEMAKFTASTDIIDYIQPGRTFGGHDLVDPTRYGRFQPRLLAFPDRRGTALAPALLTLGTDSRLHLVRKGRDAGVGWERLEIDTDLARTLGEPPKVNAFGCGWTADDRIALAIAVQAGPGQSHSRIFVAFDLTSHSDWANIPWIDCGTRPDKAMVDAITLLREGNNWTVVLSATQGDATKTYLLGSAREPSFQRAFVFTPAIDLKQILSFNAGALDRKRMVLHLLATGASGVLTLTSRRFPRFSATGELTGSFSSMSVNCPEGANVLASGAQRAEGSDLYVGGKGVVLIGAEKFDDYRSIVPEVVIPAVVLTSPVIRLVVAENAERVVTVWAVCQDGSLWITTREGGRAPWAPALKIRAGIRDIAAVEADTHVDASVVIIHKDGTAAHLWRDAGDAGIWRESPMIVSDPTEAISVPAFGTTLRLFDREGTPRPGVTVKIRTTALSSLVVNGASVTIGPDVVFETQTRNDGGIGIFTLADNFTPAGYRFDIAGFETAIDLNPGKGVLKRFETISARELRGAAVNGGKLVPNDVPDADLEATVKALNGAAKLAGGDKIPGIRLVKSDAPLGIPLNVGAALDGYAIAIRSDGDRISVLSASATQAVITSSAGSGGFFNDIGQTLSDFFEGAWSKVKQGVTYVLCKVEQAYEFICAIGDKIKKFIISTLEEIGSFFKWIFEKIKVSYNKIRDYLKFLLDWDDILYIRDHIKKLARQRLGGLKAQIRASRAGIEKPFDDLMTLIRKEGEKRGVRPSKPPAKLTKSEISMGEMAKGQADTSDQVQGNSLMSWVMDNLTQALGQLVQINLPSSDPGLADFDKLLEEHSASLTTAFDEFKADLDHLFGGKPPSIADIGVDTITKIAITLGVRVAEALLAALKRLVTALMDLLEGFFDTLEKVLFATVRLPFIEKLVKLVADANVDTSFQLADIIALPAAIPATIALKLINGSDLRRDALETAADSGKLAESDGAEAGMMVAAAVGGVAASSSTSENEGVLQWAMKYAAGTTELIAGSVSFIAFVLDAAAAPSEAVSLETTGVFGWVGYAGSCMNMLFLEPQATLQTVSRSMTAGAFSAVCLAVGIFQSFMGYRTRRHMGITKTMDISAPEKGMLATTLRAQGTQIDLVCNTLRMVLRGVQFVADPDDWTGRHCAIYMCRMGADSGVKVAILSRAGMIWILGASFATACVGLGLSISEAVDLFPPGRVKTGAQAQ